MGGAWLRFHSGMNAAVEDFYYGLGSWVAKHTKATLLMSLVFVLLCCLGFMNFSIENDSESTDRGVPPTAESPAVASAPSLRLIADYVLVGVLGSWCVTGVARLLLLVMRCRALL